mmetsp:Transcript_28504/g.63854  ORF Transcript_28504/g.63854 Transcript_28504/m.63854 type:complete len:338 (-) Transcript_28504:67-1080(-)
MSITRVNTSLASYQGYRYELYCISKAAGEQHACIWVMGSPSDEVKSSETSRSDLIAKERNQKRRNAMCMSSTGDFYEDNDNMDELVLRFEPPDQRNRWENPLYKVDLSSVLPWSVDGTISSDEAKCTTLIDSFKTVEIKPKEKPKKSSARFVRGKKSTKRVVTSIMDGQNDATNQPTQVANVPLSMASRNLKVGDLQKNDKIAAPSMIEDVVDSILDSFLSTQRLKEGMSTLQHVSAESNSLNKIDSIVNKVNQDILKAQETLSLTGVGGRIFVPLTNGNRRALNLSTPLRCNELREYRRQFLKWIATHPLPDGTREEETIEVYISYIAGKSSSIKS